MSNTSFLRRKSALLVLGRSFDNWLLTGFTGGYLKNIQHKKYPTQKISNTSFLRRKKGTARPGALFWQLTVIGVYQGLPKKYLTLVVLDISKIQH